MRISSLSISLATIALWISACSEAPQPVATDKQPTHIWSDQVEALYQAKEVAKYADEQYKLNQQRLQELGVSEQQ
jgi:hypothetical protein